MTIPAVRLTASQAYRQVQEIAAFGAVHCLPVETRVYGTTIVGGATVSHIAAEASYAVMCSSAAADRGLLRSHSRPRAAAGRARSTTIFGRCTALNTNQKKRLGLFDDSNGYFFEFDGETLYAVRRSNVSGSVVDTRHASSSWTEVKDAAALDFLRSHVFEIREVWPNGDVLFFIDSTLMHVISTDAAISGPGTRTARLPVSVECTNASTSAIGGFYVSSSAVLVEELPKHGRVFSGFVSQGVVTPSGVNLIGLRPALLFGAIANDAELVPEKLTITAGADCRIRLYAGATLTAPTFAAPNAASFAEVDVTTTALPSAGDIIAEFACGLGTHEFSLEEIAPRLRVLANGSTLDTLAVAALSLSGGNTTVRCGLVWKEIR